jgi:hypothetical protein
MALRAFVSMIAAQIRETDEYQHQGNTELKTESDSRRNHHSEHNDCAANNEHRKRMPNSPQSADPRRTAERLFTRDHGGHRHDMIGVGGVL